MSCAARTRSSRRRAPFRFRARPDPAEAVSFIDAHRDRFGVDPICRTLGVAPSTYYARKTRPPCRRALDDAALLEGIRVVHEQNYGVYGSRRVWKALGRQGVHAPRCRVERLMRRHGICGAQPGRKRRWLTVAGDTAARPADLVERRFVAERPNRLWVCDLTYGHHGSSTIRVTSGDHIGMAPSRRPTPSSGVISPSDPPVRRHRVDAAAEAGAIPRR